MFRQYLIVVITKQTSDKKEAELRVIKTSDDPNTDRNIEENLWGQFQYFKTVRL